MTATATRSLAPWQRKFLEALDRIRNAQHQLDTARDEIYHTIVEDASALPEGYSRIVGLDEGSSYLDAWDRVARVM